METALVVRVFITTDGTLGPHEQHRFSTRDSQLNKSAYPHHSSILTVGSSPLLTRDEPLLLEVHRARL